MNKRNIMIWIVLAMLGALGVQLDGVMPGADSSHAAENAAQKPAVATDDVDFIYTKHARERMQQRGANDNEVEDTVLTGQQVPAKGDKQKFEKLYSAPCEYNGRRYDRKKVEVVTAKQDEDWVVITVIADCK